MAGIFGYVPNNTLGALYLTPQTGNEAIWRQALANQGSISKPRPSLGGRLENATVDTLRRTGVSDRTAARLGSKTFSAVNDLTPVGNLTGADEGAAQFGRGLTRGDLGQAALGAGVFGLSVLPGAAGRVVGKVGKGMFGRLMRDESGAIRAWHGSPHDFDKFSLSGMGTGMGGQVYAPGLNFSESRDVALGYRDYLSRQRPPSLMMEFGGQEYPFGSAHYKAAEMAKMASEYRADIIKDYGSIGKWAKQDLAATGRSDANDILRMFKSIDGSQVKRNSYKGRLYEVNIAAKPDDFPAWEALGGDDRARINAAKELFSTRAVPGVRHFADEVGDNTRNYVVFDDSLIDILNKY